MASINDVLYVGVTNELGRRVYEHKEGLHDSYTKKYKCNKLVYFEPHNDIRFAIRREKTIKRWHRSWKLDMIRKINPLFKDLSSEWTDL